MGSSTWHFGIRALPLVEGEEKACVGILWTSEGAPVHLHLLESDVATDADIRAAFAKALSEPLEPAPAPKRVIVESGAMAKRLRPLLKGVAIEIGPTAEVDAVFDALLNDLSETGIDREIYEAIPEAWHGELEDVWRALDRTAPWEVLPASPALTLASPTLGLPDARVVIMGHAQSSFGILLFTTADDQAAFEQSALGELPIEEVPSCIGVDLVTLPLESGTVDTATLTALERGARRAANEGELLRGVAASLAVARFVEEHAEVLDDDAAWARGIHGRYEIPVHDTTVVIELSVRDEA